ncbi:translation initiation factor IF-2-like [Artibeus jamaicensis]|uniref:translation initiation factor IF-2-like n=1 Tax=Artibeus jamaicensis TaxID=9417 RepID=UPI00235AB6C1|nr:translation initiation factor IF-2-like [Artibeus jamaicensis]
MVPRRLAHSVRSAPPPRVGGSPQAQQCPQPRGPRPGERGPSRAAASGARRSASPRAGPGAGWAARTRGRRCRAGLAPGPVLVRGRARVLRCLLRARWAGRCSVPPPPARPVPAPRAPPGRPPTSASATRRPHPGREGEGRGGAGGRGPGARQPAGPRPHPPRTQFPCLSPEPHDSAPLWRDRNKSRLCLPGLGAGCRRLQSSLTPECDPSGNPRWGPGRERPWLSRETQSEDPGPPCGGSDGRPHCEPDREGVEAPVLVLKEEDTATWRLQKWKGTPSQGDREEGPGTRGGAPTWPGRLR